MFNHINLKELYFIDNTTILYTYTPGINRLTIK